MREIKFRAWDKKNKKMGELLIIAEGFVQTYCTHFSELVIPMQFTGLKDKNGKECYEGDKVCNCLSGHQGVVEWVEKLACFYVVNGEEMICSLGAFGCDGFTIEGNIYENPELLKEDR